VKVTITLGRTELAGGVDRQQLEHLDTSSASE
jgi:hypothetical protein